MKIYLLALATCVVVVVFLLWMLRTRRIKEKYAAVWLVLAVAVCIIGAFPATVASIASFVGVATSSNLLFASALAVLFGVCIQLSVELSSNEEETRTLTEEIALLRLDFERLQQATGHESSDASSTTSEGETAGSQPATTEDDNAD